MLAQQMHRETLSPYPDLRKETVTPQPQKTQLRHHAGLVPNIPGKPWANCNLNPVSGEEHFISTQVTL